jgi:hypothetical protein
MTFIALDPPPPGRMSKSDMLNAKSNEKSHVPTAITCPGDVR